ncbi:MAG: MFS transporter [Thermodesulfobacteriota bacterium]
MRPTPSKQDPARPEAGPAPVSVRKWWAFASIGLGVLMATLDMSIVNVSLPTLVQELKTTFPAVQWVILSYALVVTSLTLGVGRLGDMHGKKKLYGLGLSIFTLSSLLCGLAPDVGWLIGFRVVQGLGAVMMQALGLAIVIEVFPAAERGRALGTMGAIVSTGLALGPALGGLLIGYTGWRSIFLVNVPLGCLAGLFVWRFVPRTSPGRPGQRFDLPGAAIMMFTLLSYALGMTLAQGRGFDDVLVLGLLLAAGLGLGVFLKVEKRTDQPMIDLSLFRNTLFSLNLIMGFLVFVVLAISFILPFFLELVKGYSTEKVGLLMMATPICMGLVAPLAGTLADRFGSRGISLLGLLVIAGACFTISTLHAEVSGLGYVLRVMPLGLGMGLFQSPNNTAIMGAVPRERLGVASGLLVLTRALGNTTGLPLVGVLFTHQMLACGGLSTGVKITEAPAQALVCGLSRTILTTAVGILMATGLAATALWLDRRRRAASR